MDWIADNSWVSESGKTTDSGGRYRIRKEMDWYVIYLDGIQVNMCQSFEEATELAQQ